MTRPKVTRKYGTYMLDILDKLHANPAQPVVFRYPKQSQAKNAQLDFLCFRNAAVSEGMDKGSPAMYPDLNAYRTRVRQDAGDWVLSIYHIDFSEEAKDARRQLGLPEPKFEVEQEDHPAYPNRPKKPD